MCESNCEVTADAVISAAVAYKDLYGRRPDKWLIHPCTTIDGARAGLESAILGIPVIMDNRMARGAIWPLHDPEEAP